MSFQTWWAFFIGTALICASPGPNMLNVFSHSIKYGFKEAMYTMRGSLLAVSLIIVTSVLGVGALLAASPTAFNVLRYLGAAYLIYIGVKSCFSNSKMVAPKIEGEEKNKSDHFKKGFYVGMSNPKSFLFAVAFFPQFIDVAKPALPQFAILFITFLFNECSCYVAYALGGERISKFITNEKYTRAINIAIGFLFIGFGVMLLSYKLGS